MDLSALGNAKWCGGVEGETGVVYGVPNFCGHVLRIDTVGTGTATCGRTVATVGWWWLGHKGKCRVRSGC